MIDESIHSNKKIPNFIHNTSILKTTVNNFIGTNNFATKRDVNNFWLFDIDLSQIKKRM